MKRIHKGEDAPMKRHKPFWSCLEISDLVCCVLCFIEPKQVVNDCMVVCKRWNWIIRNVFWLNIHIVGTCRWESFTLSKLGFVDRIKKIQVFSIFSEPSPLGPIVLMKNLKSIDIDGFKMEDEKARLLVHLKQLSHMRMECCYIEDRSMEWIGDIGELECLELYNCYSEDSDYINLSGIQKMRRLKKLSLFKCDLDINQLELIKPLNNIENIMLVMDKSGADCPHIDKYLSDKPNLQYLYFSGIRTNATLYEKVQKMGSIRTFGVEYDYLTVEKYQHLSKMSQLEALTIFTDRNIFDINFYTFKNLTKLAIVSHYIHEGFLSGLSQLNPEELVIYFNDSDNCSLSFISNFSRLRTLSIKFSPTDRKGLESLAYLNNLTKLTIIDLEADNIEPIRSLCNLESIVFINGYFTDYKNRRSKKQESAYKFDSQSFECLSTLKRLKCIEIEDFDVNPDYIHYLSGNPSLDELVLSSNGISGKIKNLSRLSKLSRLEIRYNELTDESAYEIASLRMLKTLDVSFNKTTSKFIERISDMKHLAILEFNGNEIDDSAVPFLMRMESLVSLFSDISDFTDESLKILSDAKILNF